MHTELQLSKGHDFQAGQYSPVRPRVPGVKGEIAYLSPATKRPCTFMYPPPAGVDWDNCEYDLTPVRIADARAMAASPSIDAEGFELWDAPIAAMDFSDGDVIQRGYYPDAAELAKHVMGADHAFIFDHAVRRREAGRPALKFGRDGAPGSLGAVGRVHADYTEASGQRRLDIIAQEHGPARNARRFAIVNVWRSIGGRVMDTPLALCDARSVSARDLVVAELRYPGRNGEIYLVCRSPYHLWAWFPDMDNGEALIFKQYDAQVSGVARFTPHSAFDLPAIPDDAPLRESIEVRCLVTWE